MASLETTKPEITPVSVGWTESHYAYMGNHLIGSSRKLTLTEERYLMILIAQAARQLKRLKKVTSVQYEPDKMICPEYICFSPRELLTEGAGHYDRIRIEAEKFASKTITFEIFDEGKKKARIVHLAGPIDIDIESDDNTIKMRIEPELWRLLLDMSAGYTYLDLKYVFRLSRTESIRLLPMFYNSSLFKKGIQMNTNFDLTYNLNTLKKMFGMSNEYKTATGKDDYAGFLRRVILPALDEIRKSGCPYYADYEILETKGSRGKPLKNIIHFIPRRNLDVFQDSFPCLLPDKSPIRSPRIMKLLDMKYDFGTATVPKQITNIIAFAQKYYYDDQVLYNTIYDMAAAVRRYENPAAGFIVEMKKKLKQEYGVTYVSPTEQAKEKRKANASGREYADWELIQSSNDMPLNEKDNDRYKILIEAQNRLKSTDFSQIVKLADELQRNLTNDAPLPGHLKYGIAHLSDREIYDNVVAGIIDDASVDRTYDQECYHTFEYIVGLQLDCQINKTAPFTWEYVNKKLTEWRQAEPKDEKQIDDTIFDDGANFYGYATLLSDEDDVSGMLSDNHEEAKYGQSDLKDLY